jgi:hypothetical protein
VDNTGRFGFGLITLFIVVLIFIFFVIVFVVLAEIIVIISGEIIFIDLFVLQSRTSVPIDGSWDQFLLDVFADVVILFQPFVEIVLCFLVFLCIILARSWGLEEIEKAVERN